MYRQTPRIHWRQRSVSRRRLLNGALSFGLGVVGLTLVGCGGDDDEPALTADTESDAAAEAEQEQAEPADEPEAAEDTEAAQEQPEPADEPAPTPSGETLTFTPSADTTLYRENDNSNGAGEHVFAGLTNGGQERRALLRFDLEAMAAGTIVTQVELTLSLSRTSSGAVRLSLYRLAHDWGEAGSDAPANEGRGAPAVTGDATWNHASFNTEPWTAPGGDFVAPPSATTSVSQIGPYTSSGAGLVADVQAWVDGDAPNYGWILLADEPSQPSAKRFDSRESASPPSLAVTFEPR